MVKIRIWSGSGESGPSSSFLEKARELRMPKSMAYRMDDGSLFICLPYNPEQVLCFEELLQGGGFSEIPIGQAGSLKKAHYAKISYQ